MSKRKPTPELASSYRRKLALAELRIATESVSAGDWQPAAEATHRAQLLIGQLYTADSAKYLNAARAAMPIGVEGQVYAKPSDTAPT